LKEILIDRNEDNQRLDRFLKKYLAKASTGFIYKMLRKKRIKLNGNRANPEDIIKEGDKLQLFLGEETLENFKKDIKDIKRLTKLDIIYEDANLVLINKTIGTLSHATDGEYGNNVVDQLVSYLYEKGDYHPRIEKTFTPSICNRLDRNTSGIIIGAKNYITLQMVNDVIKKGYVKKYYKCIVKGRINSNKELKGYLVKDEEKNRVQISSREVEGGKDIRTKINTLKASSEYTLLEIDLITGRTHQIRAHLSSTGHPVIGDLKYGDSKTNRYFKDNYGLSNQFLHAYKVIFNGLSEPLDYLNGKAFVANMDKEFDNIIRDLFE